MPNGSFAFGSFQYDDFANVLNDPATTELAALADRMGDGIRPLTRLTYAACAQLLGEWAGGGLLVQLLVHVVAVLGAARLTRLRTGNATAAASAAACFALRSQFCCLCWLLEDHPVADDVLDAVGHHRAGHAQKIGAIARMPQGREDFGAVDGGPVFVEKVNSVSHRLPVCFASYLSIYSDTEFCIALAEGQCHENHSRHR